MVDTIINVKKKLKPIAVIVVAIVVVKSTYAVYIMGLQCGWSAVIARDVWSNLLYWALGPLLLTWFNFNPSLDN